MRSAHLSRGAVRVTLIAVLAALLPLSIGSAGAQPQTSAPRAASVAAVQQAAPVVTARRTGRWAPPVGVLINDPTTRSKRAILARVIKAVNQTPRGEIIRIVVWNLDDKPVARALVRAHRRGATVQVVVSGVVDNPNYTWLAGVLNRNKKDRTFARQCRGACRSSAGITHSKIFLFSRVNRTRYTTMFGSTNLATPAGNRQWNDLVTLRNRPLYDYFVGVFDQYAKDRAIANPYQVRTIGNVRATLFPARNRNPVLAELRKVKCVGTTGGTGTGGRTKIRIAIAGWFDAYGGAIATQLRTLWDRGCDVKVVTTLAGRGVNKTLRARTGRGPVPIRNISVDRNGDGTPERYLHLKAMVINGNYDGNSGASVVFTGSPNWSSRAQRSDEVWVRMVRKPGFVAQYVRFVDSLYRSPSATARKSSSELALKRDQSFGPPGVFELD